MDNVSGIDGAFDEMLYTVYSESFLSDDTGLNTYYTLRTPDQLSFRSTHKAVNKVRVGDLSRQSGRLEKCPGGVGMPRNLRELT